MTIRDIISKLSEIEWTSDIIEQLNREVEVLENKSKAVEVKNTEIQDLKTKITTLEAKNNELNENLDEARTKGASQADGFKTLYEEKKVELNEAKKQIEDLISSKSELEQIKKDQEEKIEKEIELLYKELPDDKKDFVKNMAERYPLAERISFITDFIEKFSWVQKKKGWKVVSNDIATELEDAQKMFDDILKIPTHRRTEKQKRDLITLWKVLNGSIPLN